MELCNRSVIRTLMAEAGTEFRREYGQNFLVSPDIPLRCAEACEGDRGAVILEIGAGIGCLTDALARRFRHVIAVEIDEKLIPVLERTMAEHQNVTILHADIMKVDIPALLAEQLAAIGAPAQTTVSVCANLPYYITTPILMHLVESRARFSSLTVMVQSEVADRLCAGAGEGDYGAITAVLGYYGQLTRLFTVPAGCFMPAPKVNSAVVRLALYQTPVYQPADEALFFQLIKGAFGQRRKTLVNALHSLLPRYDKETLKAAILRCGFSENIRGERLSTADFVRLSDALQAPPDGADRHSLP